MGGALGRPGFRIILELLSRRLHQRQVVSMKTGPLSLQVRLLHPHEAHLLLWLYSTSFYGRTSPVALVLCENIGCVGLMFI